MKKLGLVLLLDMGCAYAAGDGGSMLDLKWPFVNLFILVGVIVWKVKNPLSEMFSKKASDVEYLYAVAQEKEKESNIKYEMNKKKMESVDRDCDVVLEKFRNQEVRFAKEHEKEVAAFVEKLRKEKDRRIAVEKKKILKEVEKFFMADIIVKAKKQIGEDPTLKNRVTTGFLAKIG